MSNNKTIHLIIFGIGNVGSTLINQVQKAKKEVEENQHIRLEIPVLLNSKLAFFQKTGVSNSWESDFDRFSVPYKIQDVIDFVSNQQYEHVIAIDATASQDFVEQYIPLVKNGFNIVAANKIANTLSTEFYKELRKELKVNQKQFLYETNVGAGLPIIQAIQNLRDSGENVRKVRGVFSGSLSYIFNTFSAENKTFDQVLNEAQEKGFTEPDPRIDLSGKDVGRKLLILARELSLEKEFTDVKIEDLVPAHLNGSSTVENFRNNQKELNKPLHELKAKLKQDEVIRHIGELDLKSGELEVKLAIEKKTSPFGSLKNADSSFEVYSDSYGDYPLVIQGAGAGAAVTARGVFSDILKISQSLPLAINHQPTTNNQQLK